MKNPHFTNEINVIIVTVEIILLGVSEKKKFFPHDAQGGMVIWSHLNFNSGPHSAKT